MKQRIVSKAYAAFLLYLATLPLFWLIAAALALEALWQAALLPFAALLLTGCAGLMPPKHRTAALLAGIGAMAILCAAVFIKPNPTGMLLFLPCLLLMLLFMPAMARSAHQEWTVSHLGFGMMIHLAAQLLKGMPAFSAAAPALLWAFTAYLLTALFSFNRIVLTENSSTASKALLARNRAMLVVLCILALLLANLKAVGAGIRAALVWCITAAAHAIAWILSHLGYSQQTGGGGAAGSMFSDLAETAKPSLFAQILQIVLAVIAGLIAAVLLFYALRHLCRLCQKAFRLLRERLQAYRQRISADYEDQSENLLDWEEIRKTTRARLDRLKRRYLPTAWEKLTPTQRVRRVYALLLRKPDTADPARTAREMLTSGCLPVSPEDAHTLAALYDRARYSDHPISAAEADAVRKRTGV